MKAGHLLCALLVLLLGISPLHAQREWTVGPGQQFRMVQDALNARAVCTGDVLRLAPGNLIGPVRAYTAFTVTRGIRIVGERANPSGFATALGGDVLIEDIPADQTVLLTDLERGTSPRITIRRCRGPVLLTGVDCGLLRIEDSDLVIFQDGSFSDAQSTSRIPARILRSRVCLLNSFGATWSDADALTLDIVDSRVTVVRGGFGPLPFLSEPPEGAVLRLRRSSLRYTPETLFRGGSAADFDTDSVSDLESVQRFPRTYEEDGRGRLVYPFDGPATGVLAFSLPGRPVLDPGRQEVFLDPGTTVLLRAQAIRSGGELFWIEPLRVTRNRLGIPFLIQGASMSPEGVLDIALPYLVVY